jgi:hypothetical protein
MSGRKGMIRFARGSAVAAATAVATAVLFVLPACNNTDPTTLPTPPPPASQTVRAVVASTSFTDFPPDVYLGVPIPLSQAGVLDFTVNWTFPETYMIVAFGNQPCSFQELNSKKCPFLIYTEGSNKPRVITTAPLAVGNYFFVIYSQPYSKKTGVGTDRLEAVSLQIGLTVSTGTRSAQTITVHPQLLKP